MTPVVILAIWAAVWVAANTSQGVYHRHSDGGSYVGMADELRNGHGPTTPSKHKFDDFTPREAVALDGHVPSTTFPPGYSIVLAAVSLFTGDVHSAVRVAGVMCVFLNVVLLGLLAARMTAYRSVIAATAPVALVLFVPDQVSPFDNGGWLMAHLGVFSEPLFTLLVTGALLATGSALTDRRNGLRPALLLAVGLAGAALLTRWPGAGIVLTMSLGFVLFGRQQGLVRRLRQAVAVGAGALVPIALFQVWSMALGAGPTRALAYHPSREKTLLARIGRSFLPYRWSDQALWLGAAVVLLLIAVAAVWLPPRARALWNDEEEASVLYRLTAIFVGSYLTILLVTLTFLDANTSFNARIVGPVRGFAAAALVAAIYRLASPYVRTSVLSALVFVAAASLLYLDRERQQFWFDQAGRPPPAQTAAEKELAELPKDTIIVTDNPSTVYLTAGQRSFSLPLRTIFMTQEVNDDFAWEMSEWGEILNERGGYAFFTPQWGGQTATVKELDEHVDLRLVSRSGGEALYRIVQQDP
jgi:hypothetical protein